MTQIVVANALCSSISSSDENQQSLLRLQCYANALYNNSAIRTAMQSSNLCIRDVKANWGTTEPSKFLVDQGPLKSKAEHAAELFTYTGADSGTFRMREDDFREVRTNNSQVTWYLENTTTINLRQRADGHLNLEFIQETHNLESRVAASYCRNSLGRWRHADADENDEDLIGSIYFI